MPGAPYSASQLNDLTVDVAVTSPALGNLFYRGSSKWSNLAGNTTTTQKVLAQTGNGSVSAAPAWTSTLQSLTFTPAMSANAATDGVVLQTAGTASSGNQYFSPSLDLIGQCWQTGTSTSVPVSFIQYVQPVQGSTASGSWVLASQIGGSGGYNPRLEVSSGGAVTILSDSTATHNLMLQGSSGRGPTISSVTGSNLPVNISGNGTYLTVTENSNGQSKGLFGNSSFAFVSGIQIGWYSSSSDTLGSSIDTALTRNAAANVGFTNGLTGGSLVTYATIGSNGLVMSDTYPLVFGTTTGTKIGTSTTQKLAFWNATPIVQPAAVAAPSGGSTIDTQARTAIQSLINILSAAAGGNGLTA